jgi:hypothetical protein
MPEDPYASIAKQSDDPYAAIATLPSAASPIEPPKFTVGAPSTQPMDTVLTPHEFGERLREPNHPNPGVSEGRGLREGLAEYDRQSFGSMGEGAVDIGRGRYARGGHEIISGATNMMTPAVPLMAPAAPVAFARGAIGGAAGGYLAHKGAEVLGATPDQADLAGDVGGIAGGTAAASAPVAKLGRTAIAVAKPFGVTAENLPVVGSFVKGGRAAMKVPGELREIWNPTTAPAPEAPAEVYRPGYRAPRAFYGGQPPEPIPQRSGLLLEGEVAKPQPPNPALTSEARTLPGQISPEVIYPPVKTAAPIPRRSGLALPAAPEVEPPATSAAPVEQTAAARAATSEPAAAAPPARSYRLGGDREATGPGGIQNTPDVLNNGESALRQVLTGQDNEALLKIAKSRGINVSKESQLKPAAADKLLVEKIISDFTPEELDEAHGRYVENSRFRHDFGDIGPEAWKTLGLETFFPDLKIPAARMIRTRAAITNAPLANAMPETGALGDAAAAIKKSASPRAARRAPASTVAAPSEDLMAGLKQSLDPKVIEAIRSRKPKR